MRGLVLGLLLLSLLSCATVPEGDTPLDDATPTAAVLPTSPLVGPATSWPPSLGGMDAVCPGSGGMALLTGTAVYAVPELDEPPPRQWFVDPVFGTCLVRVTDRAADLAPDDPSPGMANEYARVQAFNAGGTRLLLRGTDGGWYLYDAETLLPLGELPLVREPRWDDEDPERIYFTGETRLLAYDLGSGETTVVHDFAADLPGQDLGAVWTRYEGRPSRDRRYWAFMAENGDWLPAAFLVYDMEQDRVTVRDVRRLDGIQGDVDHVTMSPLGTYFLASFDAACDEGRLGDDGHGCGLMAYERDLSGGRGLLRIIGHYDLALDAGGREVAVYQDIDADRIAMVDLESGAVTPLWDIDFSHTAIGLHFSGLAYDRPGWAVVSTHDDDPGTYTWMDDQVFLVELRAGGQVIRLAHTHSVVNDEEELDYWAEPHATTNGDLTRILFGSNWGRTGSGAVDVFMIAVPAGVVDTGRAPQALGEGEG
jgi:hypothetical protein